MKIDDLKQILNYNPETGDWIWLKPVQSSVKAAQKAGSLKLITKQH